MLKMLCKLGGVIILCVSTIFVSQQLKNNRLKKSIIKEIFIEKGKKYNISNNLIKLVSPGNINFSQRNGLNGYKLVYEISFDCSICLEDLIKINDFFLKLNTINEIALVLITTERSASYVEYQVAKSLPHYDLWVVQQQFRNDNFGLYLLDAADKIIMAGDIIKYPFLENDYIKAVSNEACK